MHSLSELGVGIVSTLCNAEHVQENKKTKIPLLINDTQFNILIDILELYIHVA